MDDLVSHPERFAALTGDSSRPGWIALHANDLPGAAEAFDPNDADGAIGRARALWELSLFYADLARSGDEAWLDTFATWSQKSSIPLGSALTYVAGLAAREQGEAEVAAAWFRLSAGAREPEVALAASRLASSEPGQAFGGEGLPPLLQRYDEHLRARASGDLSALLPSAAEPLVREDDPRPDGSTLSRAFYDPQILWTLSHAYRVQAARALGVEDALAGLGLERPEADPLAAVVFSSVLSREALESETGRAAEAPGTLGASGTALASLGLEPALPATDDPDWARGQVHLLDASFDAWAAGERGSAGPDGLALLDDLQLLRVFRSRVLLALARKALIADHPWQAATFAQLALDAENARSVTPVNHPGLQAVLIHAQLQTGRTREALDALQPLVALYPALTGLDEVLGDLAILQGLDRYGDSKEN